MWLSFLTPLLGHKIQPHYCVWGQGLLRMSWARRCPGTICGVTDHCGEIASPTLLHSIYDDKFEGVGRGNHCTFQLRTIKSEHIRTAGVPWLSMHQPVLNHRMLSPSAVSQRRFKPAHVLPVCLNPGFELLCFHILIPTHETACAIKNYISKG